MLIQMTANIVLGVPCFFSDGFSCYFSALIEYYHRIKVFPKTGKPGRPRNPVREPHEHLVYGQVVKHDFRVNTILLHTNDNYEREKW
ncbi:hypothetical protein QUF80_19575 [Desulfococcaceae bacterium HSG8]|nr:hypothetical protein [Desulfococcaceae bacterium HSG8]